MSAFACIHKCSATETNKTSEILHVSSFTVIPLIERITKTLIDYGWHGPLFITCNKISPAVTQP